MGKPEQTSIPTPEPRPSPTGTCEFCGRAAGAAVEMTTALGARTGRYIHTCKSEVCIDKAHRMAKGVKL